MRVLLEYCICQKHDKMHLKKVIPEKQISTPHRGPSLYVRDSFFLKNGVKKQDPGFQMQIHNTGDELHSAGP
jgi:hypothetical protein